MKKLALLRHAESSWDHPGKSDFERPLNQRGFHDAPRVGRHMAEAGIKPGAIISSSALRARTTAELVAKELGIKDEDIRFSEALYHASASEMLAVLDTLTPNDHEVVCVGHNPGISALANRIADVPVSNLPPAACVYIEADIDNWQDLAGSPGKLVFFASPQTVSDS